MVRTLQTAGYVHYEDLPLKTHDGRQIEVEFVSNMYRVDGAAVIQCNIRDTTTRKQAEEALRQSEEQFRAMFETASIGMAQADVCTGQWLRVNAKLCAITGYPAEELLRLRVSEVTHPEDREQDWQAFQRVVRGDAPDYRMEKRYVCKDGTLVWVNVNMTVIRDAAGQPLRTMATIEDITDRKRLEVERIGLEAQLRQQQKLEAIGTLASGVAHEINNPINGILNYAQLIADKGEPGSQAATYAGEIIHETERVATIVRNLLQFARQEKHTYSLARPADLVEQTLSLVRAVLRRDQITLTVDVPEDLPALKCRSQQIQQVVMNLLTNARDALNAKYPGYHADKTIRITARELGGISNFQFPISNLTSQGTGSPIAHRKSQIENGPEAAIPPIANRKSKIANGHALASPHRRGSWRGYPAGDPAPHLRPLLHHQAPGQGHGSGPVHQSRDRQGPPRRVALRDDPGPGHAVPHRSAGG